MPHDLPPALRDVAERQRGVISRGQALGAGMSSRAIEFQMVSGRWQRVQSGVYSVFTGSLDRRSTLWAAVLRCGPGAALSHQTAAELDGLLDRPAPLIYVTIPATRRVCAAPGIVIRTRFDIDRARHPVRLPPRTRVEETVLDLWQSSRSLDAAIGWITSALGRRLTTQGLLLEASARRSKLRWRTDIDAALSPDAAGVHSLLEFRYVRDVERAHQLPRGRRQATVRRGGRREYRDVLYDEFALAVELDGKIAHPDDRRWPDIRRDNAAAADGLLTLRYGYLDVTSAPCLVAEQVIQALRTRGWSGTPRRCSPDCPVS